MRSHVEGFAVVSRGAHGDSLKRADPTCHVCIRCTVLGFFSKLTGIIMTAAALLLCPIVTDASVNIPPDSPFYEDLDRLIARGLIKTDLSSTKPFTEKEAGRLLAEAGYCAEAQDVSAADQQLLDRLHSDYQQEISEAKGWGKRASTFFKPVDEFSVAYHSLDGPFSIFNNEGIDYFDGNNASVRLQSEARLWSVFTFYVEPLFLYNGNVRGIEGESDSTVRLHKGYIKFTVDNFEIEWGKDSLWWGPGYHGALLISNNARPFELFKVSNPRATLLPWIFRYLGPFRYNVFFSELDREAASGHPPDSKLFGARIGFKPHPLFEFGISYLTHFGGDRPGIGDLHLSDYYHIIFSNECRSFDKRDSNKQAAVDAALTIPNISDFMPLMDSLTLYAEWGGEDQGTFPDRRAYLAGIVFNNVFTIPGVKFRAEYTDLSPESNKTAWYAHSMWPMRHYGRVFGHHAGTDSDDLFFELSHSIRDSFFYRLSFDRERSGLSQQYTQEKQQYFIEAGWRIKEWLGLSLRYGREEITNAGTVQGAEEENSLIAAEAEMRF